MKTLYIFGDSYADTFFQDDKSWPYILSKKLNYNLKLFGQCGASLDYLFYNFNKVRTEFNQDDIIIFLLVNKERQWFFKDKPQVSGYWQNLEEMGCDKEQCLAVEYYGKYLTETDTTHNIDFFLYLFNDLSNFVKPIIVFTEHENAQKYKNKHDRILYFMDVLQDISLEEVEDLDELENEIKRDPRSCHLCYSNHEILTNNFLHLLFPNNYEIKPYLSKFLTIDKIKDLDFKKNEMPDNIWVNK